MKNHIGTLALTAAAILAFAAIFNLADKWWQLALAALLALFIGAALKGQPKEQTGPLDEREAHPWKTPNDPTK